MLKALCCRHRRALTQLLLIMRITAIIILASCLTASAKGLTQGVTISVKNVPLEKVFAEIKKQTGYSIFYNYRLIEKSKPVTVSLKNASIDDVMKACLKDQPLDYEIADRSIVIKEKQQIPNANGGNENLNNIPRPIDVHGRIVNENGEPVAGASIVVKGTQQGTSTDANGYYTLQGVKENAVLVITAVSIEPYEVKLNGRTELNATVKIKVKQDEEIVVAYNKTTVQRNVSSLTVVKGSDIETLPNRSFDKSLQGLVPGLLVTSGSGQPGSGVSNFILRGIATGADPTLSASTLRSPLIVIDGIPVTQDHFEWPGVVIGTAIVNPMAQLNPSDIETITVLKDAAAIALYGSKASNGVILLTTKKGKAGKTVIGFKSQLDVSTRLKGNIQLLNQDEYLKLVTEAFRNSNPTTYPSDAAVITFLKTKFPVRSDGSFYPFTNWENEIYNNHATTTTNDLSFSGGNERSNFYLNLEYTDQDGVVKHTGYDRKSIRFNFENKPTNWLKIGLNTSLSYNKQDYGSLSGLFPVATASLTAPLNPIRLEDGSYFLNFAYPFVEANPIAANEFNLNRNLSFRGLNKLSAEINFLKYFRFTSSLGTDFMLLEAKEKIDSRLVGSGVAVGDGRIRERDTRNLNLIATNVLKFNRQFHKNHFLDILAGQEAQVLNSKYLEASGTQLQIPGFDQIDGTSNRNSAGSLFKQTLLSYFGQANYSYRNKYSVTSSLRADGASNFGDKNRFGTYWSTGVGWVISEEEFLKKSLPWINYFKVRGSIGEAGNSFAIDRFTRYDLLTTVNYVNGIAVYPSLGSMGNPEIKWEQTFSWDAGIESRYWNNRITFTADFYKRKTSNMVYTISLPLTTGDFSIKDNIGNIANKGVELSLALGLVKTRNFKWDLNFNWSKNKNILTKANVPLATISSTVLANEVGRNFNSFYLRKWVGVDPATGAPMWLDSTGKANTNIRAAKQTFVGKPQPDGFGSFSNIIGYGNFQLLAVFYYQYGFQVYNTTSLVNDGLNAYANQDVAALNRWQKPGDVADNPKRFLNNNAGQRPSTRFLHDGDFIRLQTLSLGYSFPNSTVEKMKLSALKIFAAAYNVALWTKYKGGDVSNVDAAGQNALSYPNQKTYSLGINVSF